MKTTQTSGEPVAVENIMNPDNRKVRSEIRHAFDDAIITAAMEDTEEHAYRAYRRVLYMHFEIYLDEFCSEGDEEDLFWSIVDCVAASMNQTDIFRKAMEVF
jgi:hypothetical protein